MASTRADGEDRARRRWLLAILFGSLVLSTPAVFADDVEPGKPVRAQPIEALRTAVNAKREVCGLGEIKWTDTPLVGKPIRAVHITELQDGLREIFTAPARNFTGDPAQAPHFEPIIAGQTPIRASDLTEIWASLRYVPCCGDGTCDDAARGGTESCRTCPQDCPLTGCGDGCCDSASGECSTLCAQDCGVRCGDGCCDQAQGESCSSCPDDCGGPCPSPPSGPPAPPSPPACDPTVCGDKVCCGPVETNALCPGDCPSTPCDPTKCGDRICCGPSETDQVCAQDCPGGSNPPPPGCACDANPTQGACGSCGDPNGVDRLWSFTCTPPDCKPGWCTPDYTGCCPTTWQPSGGCGAQGCPADSIPEVPDGPVRTGCANFRCQPDASCVCSCGPYKSVGCGVSPCSPTESTHVRTCSPPQCDREYRCSPDTTTCGGTGCGGPGQLCCAQGRPCSTQSNCCSGLICSAFRTCESNPQTACGRGGSRCCNNGELCVAGGDCCSSACSESRTCVPSCTNKWGGPCDANTPCCSGFHCNSGRCGN